MDPGVFFFLALCADKASGIGDTKSSNGSDVSEKGFINITRYESRAEWKNDGVGLGECVTLGRAKETRGGERWKLLDTGDKQ